MPVGLLLRKLPSVNAMHLNSWSRPQVAADLPPPTPSQPTADRSVYTVPETRSSEWALVVGSPTPFDRIWARFTRPLTDVRFVIENLGSRRPGGAPDLPAALIANSFLRIAVENAVPEDIYAAAAIAFVDKSWLEANQIHKWSIQFSRLDEDLNI